MNRLVFFAVFAWMGMVAFAGEATKADQCSAGQSPILILGTYHMASPGLDAVNSKVDDVLAPKRQSEIEQVVEMLVKFKPTKVAVEAPRWQATANDQYQQFLQGKYRLTANEIDQIGYRLAKKMNLSEIASVDFPMFMEGLLPIEMYKPKPKAKAATPVPPVPDEDELMTQVKRQVAVDDEKLRTSTVAQFLSYINTRERYEMNQQWDVIANLTPGDNIALYEKTDLATNWYKRNLRIWTNIMAATEADDRLFVMFGAGHLPILSEIARRHPKYCLVDAREYLK
jgi:hypothetical protein